MRQTVVIHRRSVTCNCHRHIDRIDGQHTIHNLERHRAEVVVSIGEVSRCEIHSVSTNIRAASRVTSTEREVISRVQSRRLITDLDGGHIVTRHHLFRTVVIHCTAVLGDGHRHIDRIDGQHTIHNLERHRAEVVVRIGEVSRRKVHGVCTNIRATDGRIAIEREVIRGVKRVADSHVITCHDMFISIIICRTTVLGDGHRHIDRVNRLVTVCHVEGHIREVIIIVGEHLTSQAHVSRTSICPGCSSRTREREVLIGVKVIANRDIVTAHTVLCSVVIHCRGVARDRHRHFNRIDLQRTVHNIERHRAKVAVRIGEVSSRKVHVVSSDVRTLGRVTAAEREVCRRVQCRGLVADLDRGHVITRHHLFSAVVVHFVAVLGDGHRHVNRVDGQRTIGHIERHRAEVAVRISKIRSRQTHRIGTDICAACRRITVEGEVCRCI